MKSSRYALTGLLSATAIFTACGDDVTKVTKIEENSGMEIVASADSLGKCTEEISGEMKFATKENAVFVCADSAWKNVSQQKETTCSAEALSDSSGFKIVCDGDSIGVVKNGAKGTDGKTGEAGKDGSDGESCKLAEGPVRDSGTSFVICGGDTVTLSDGLPGESCVLSDNGDGTLSVVCGESSTTLYKAFCDGTVYNPDSSFCFADSIVSLCGGQTFDLNESFCHNDSVVSLCGGKTYDPDLSFCFADSIVSLCGGQTFDLNESFCHNDSVVPLCGGKTYDPDLNFCANGTIAPLDKKIVWDLMNPAIEYEMFVDERDSQMYRSVKIGEQVWMAENLKYDYNEGTAGSFCYGGSAASCAKYGRLYLWSAAMDSAGVFSSAGKGCGDGSTCALDSATVVRGVCPEGWHLPSKEEFEILIGTVGGKDVAGTALKSTSGWNDFGGESGTGSYGFSALPAGTRVNYGDFSYAGSRAYFWSATESNSYSAYYMHLRYYNAYASPYDSSKANAMSVRCLRDSRL